MSPFTGWLLLRGLKAWPSGCEHEKTLWWPGILSSIEGEEGVFTGGRFARAQTAKAEVSGFGGMVNFDIDGTPTQSKQAVNSMRLFKLAAN